MGRDALIAALSASGLVPLRGLGFSLRREKRREKSRKEDGLQERPSSLTSTPALVRCRIALKCGLMVCCVTVRATPLALRRCCGGGHGQAARRVVAPYKAEAYKHAM